jgi:RND family efflux transporter MFP subunit
VPNLRFKSFLQALVVVVVGVFIAFKILTGKPKPDPKPIVAPAPVEVSVVRAAPSSQSLMVTTQGTAEPAVATRLSSEVMGQVLSISEHYRPGGFFKERDVLLSVDDTQYRLALARAESQLAAARQRLAEEQGRALQAKREWRDLGSESANALFLRKPQIEAAQAAVQAAQIEVAKAERDLDKTQIKAPFDGRVRQKLVDLGQYIGVGMPVAEVYSTDEVRIQLPLTDKQLAMLDLSLLESSNPEVEQVTVSAQVAGQTWEWNGRLIGTSADVDIQSRVHFVMVAVDDPFGFEQDSDYPPLTPGLFVSATLRGKPIEGVTQLPRSAIHTDGTIRWVDEQDILREYSVDLLQSDGQQAWVLGLDKAMRVVTQMPAGVLAGTRVRTADALMGAAN